MGSARFSYTHVIPPDRQNDLDAESIALVFQMVALDRDRFRHRIGAISQQHQIAIIALIRDLLNLD